MSVRSKFIGTAICSVGTAALTLLACGSDPVKKKVDSGGFWGAATQFTVPSVYPSLLTQAVTVKFSATTYATTKQVKVTVTKAGTADTNARVIVTGGPAGVYLYGTTDASGQVTLTIPVTATASTYTVNANDQGATSGSTTFSASTGSSSPIPSAVAIS